jgi:hypothetical protein
MVNVIYTRADDNFHPIFFFVGNDSIALEIIRESIDAGGLVWDKNNFPLLLKKFVNKFSLFQDNKYFVFRTMNDVDAPLVIEEPDLIDLITCVINKNKVNIEKYVTHPDKYMRYFSKSVIDGKFDNISFGKLFIETAPILHRNK